MSKVKLNPWTFPKGKRARLYWLCSPYRKANGDWTIRAAFQPEGQSRFEILEFPWGTLPALVIGFDYVDGLIERQAPEIVTQRIFIPNLKRGKINQAFDIDRKVLSFWNRKELGLEKVWRFYANDNLYYLPCIELLRAFLTPTKTLANMILRPYGLESLVDAEIMLENTIDMELSDEFPSSLVNHNNVTHLVWLLHNPKVRRCWNSVYQNIFAQAVEIAPYDAVNTMSKGLQISVEPPDLGSCNLSVNTFSHDKIHVITRINGFTLTDFPFKNVIYTHSSIKERRIFTPKNGKRRLVPKNDGEDFELDGERRQAKRETYQPLAEIPQTFIDFGFSPRLVRVPQGEALIPKCYPQLTPTETGGRVKIKQTDNTVSTDEPVFGGAIQPVEFAGLEMAQNIDENGLKEFLQTIQRLKEDYPHLIVEYTIVDVPGDKPFCFANGARRNCAIAEVSVPDLPPCYLFEFSRPDHWSISTLFMRIKPKNEDFIHIEQKVPQILSNAVEGNGHWTMEKLLIDHSLRLALMKHTRNLSNWSDRIMNKLMEFGFTGKPR